MLLTVTLIGIDIYSSIKYVQYHMHEFKIIHWCFSHQSLPKHPQDPQDPQEPQEPQDLQDPQDPLMESRSTSIEQSS